MKRQIFIKCHHQQLLAMRSCLLIWSLLTLIWKPHFLHYLDQTLKLKRFVANEASFVLDALTARLLPFDHLTTSNAVQVLPVRSRRFFQLSSTKVFINIRTSSLQIINRYNKWADIVVHSIIVFMGFEQQASFMNSFEFQWEIYCTMGYFSTICLLWNTDAVYRHHQIDFYMDSRSEICI